MTLGWLKLEFTNCSRVGYNFLPVPCPVCPTEGWGSTRFRSLLREGSDLGSAGWAKPRTGKRRWSKQPVNIRDHLIQNKIYRQCSSSLEILLNIKSTFRDQYCIYIYTRDPNPLCRTKYKFQGLTNLQKAFITYQHMRDLLFLMFWCPWLDIYRPAPTPKEGNQQVPIWSLQLCESHQ